MNLWQKLLSALKSLIHNITRSESAQPSAASIHDAVDKGNLRRVKALVRRKPDLVNAKGSSDGTPLHFAVAKGNQKMATLLLANGADVNSKDVYGATPLSYARMNLDGDMEYLLRRPKGQ